jgi:pyrroline-5-carboxylate reductase
LVLSIAAGISCDTLMQGLGCPVVRLMPNTPVAVGSGIVGYYSPEPLGIEKQSLLDHYLTPLGFKVPVATEEDLDRMTAFSGSGPAYIYAFLEALEDAALSLNFPPEDASTLAQTLMQGSLALTKKSSQPPQTLRAAVTSKGGTTEAGLQVLMDPSHGLSPLLKKTVDAALKRAKTLKTGK